MAREREGRYQLVADELDACGCGHDYLCAVYWCDMDGSEYGGSWGKVGMGCERLKLTWSRKGKDGVYYDIRTMFFYVSGFVLFVIVFFIGISYTEFAGVVNGGLLFYLR